MTDEEYEIIDQLYFVVGYAELAGTATLQPVVIRQVLWDIIEKGWVKCLSGPETEIWPDEDEFARNYSNYYYLATKKGLFKHNEI